MKHNQKQKIYLCTGIGNLDRTVDFEDQFKTFDDPDEALAYAKEETLEYKMRYYVYECTPIIQVDSHGVCVTKL